MMHRWSGWPGAYCMDCGNPEPTEEALFCKDGCDLKAYSGDTASDTMCRMHTAWAECLQSGCPPTKEAIEKLRAEFPQLVKPERAISPREGAPTGDPRGPQGD